MAANISNLIVPSVFAGYVSTETEKLNAFVKAGAAQVNPLLNQLLAGGAATFNLPKWKNLSATALVPSSDYATNASVQTMQAGVQKAVRIPRSLTPIPVTDLEGMLIGEDPIAAAVAQLANAHNTIRQSVLLSILSAVTTVDSGDVGSDADLTFTSAATSLSGEVIATAVATVWGDNGRVSGCTLVMNALEALDLQKAQIGAPGIVSANAVDVGFGTFLGATIIIDDDVPNDTVYVVKQGGLAFGTASTPVPFEVSRVAAAGNGGGADVLYSRDLFSYHVAGTSFTGSPVGADGLATNAELGTAANWTLAYDKKFCGVLKISHG